MESHNPSARVARSAHVPQRRNGKLRVAAILEAAATVIDEKGFDGTTMSEIADRSGTKIGSLYRFFPNKESVADKLLESGRGCMAAAFEQFQLTVPNLPVDDLADGLMSVVCELFGRPGFKKLLDSGKEWSEKREELRHSVLQRIARCLLTNSPALDKGSARDMATVILLHAKAVATNRALFPPRSSIAIEFRDLARLYLRNRLRAPSATKRAVSPSRSAKASRGIQTKMAQQRPAKAKGKEQHAIR